VYVKVHCYGRPKTAWVSSELRAIRVVGLNKGEAPTLSSKKCYPHYPFKNLLLVGKSTKKLEKKSTELDNKNWIVQRPVATRMRGVEANLLSLEWVEKTASMLTAQNSHSFSMSRICLVQTHVSFYVSGTCCWQKQLFSLLFPLPAKI
jgi:hypothetical protein